VDGPIFRVVHHPKECYRLPVQVIEISLPVEPILQRFGDRWRDEARGRREPDPHHATTIIINNNRHHAPLYQARHATIPRRATRGFPAAVFDGRSINFGMSEPGLFRLSLPDQDHLRMTVCLAALCPGCLPRHRTS
jgi:hypothetical protein